MSVAQQPLRLISAAPRSHLFTYRPSTASTICTSLTRRSYRVTRPARQEDSGTRFGGIGGGVGPAPPRLPKAEQEIFEALQRQSTGAFSTPRSPPQINQSPDSSSMDRAQAVDEIAARTDKLASSDNAQEQANPAQKELKDEFERVIEARGKGEELHPNVRRGAQPEFEGEVNPKTGEVGGPKNEPLRWGAAGEWSYNGRTTDF